MDRLPLPLHAVATVLAWLLYRRDRAARQRVLAVALTLLLALDITRRLAAPADLQARIAAWYAGHPPPPYEGAARWAWALGQTATRAWYAVTAWAVWVALRKDESPGAGFVPSAPRPTLAEPLNRGPVRRLLCPRAATLSALAFLASIIAYFLAYPLLRGAPAQWLAVGWYLIALAAELLAVTCATMRGHWPKREDRAAWISSLVLVCSSCSGLAGPWSLARPARDWFISPWIGVPTWLAIGTVTLWILLSRRTASPQP